MACSLTAGALTLIHIVPGRSLSEAGSSNLITGELTYALSSNTILRAGVSSYSETRETKDNWFGSDWEKWHDSTAVQDYLGWGDGSDTTEGAAPGWSPFKSRYSQKSNYMVNGMTFSRPGPRN